MHEKTEQATRYAWLLLLHHAWCESVEAVRHVATYHRAESDERAEGGCETCGQRSCWPHEWSEAVAALRPERDPELVAFGDLVAEQSPRGTWLRRLVRRAVREHLRRRDDLPAAIEAALPGGSADMRLGLVGLGMRDRGYPSLTVPHPAA